MYKKGPSQYYVDVVGVSVATERVQYLEESGKLITESPKKNLHRLETIESSILTDIKELREMLKMNERIIQPLGGDQ